MADFHTVQLPAAGSEPPGRRSPGEGRFLLAPRMVARHLRPHLGAFYGFVQLADDLANDPLLEPEAKLAHLDALERALVSGIGAQPWLAPALHLKASLATTGISGLHARQILQAARRDADGGRYRSWSDLLLYCRYAANPVGRHILDLHKEDSAAATGADALCSGLRVLEMVRDCRRHWVELGRCYLPTGWFREAGADPEHLVETRARPAVRIVLNRALDQADGLLRRAGGLPRLLGDTSLRMEAAVCLRRGRALSRSLRRRDPLSGTVDLTRLSSMFATLHGVMDAMALRPGRVRRLGNRTVRQAAAGTDADDAAPPVA